jgi:hypothetical protein
MKNILFILAIIFSFYSCIETPKPTSSTGVKKATAKIQTQASGLTIEQENVKRRLEEDNKVGSIKHLYVISAMSGQVLIYSTVKGKVTSSGKRLMPNSIAVQRGTSADGFQIKFPNGDYQYTGEVMQDDGTYGHSSPYVYWWDSKGIYHQHYITGGQIFHVSSRPIPVKSIILNMSK